MDKSTKRLMPVEHAPATLRRMRESPPDAFLSALSSRDFGRFAECLAQEVHARMLLPPGPEVRSGREKVTRRFESWFLRASSFGVLDSHRAQIGLRTRLGWRFRLSHDGQSHDVVEQVAFVSAGQDGISEIDLLCSGSSFSPEDGHQPSRSPVSSRPGTAVSRSSDCGASAPAASDANGPLPQRSR